MNAAGKCDSTVYNKILLKIKLLYWHISGNLMEALNQKALLVLLVTPKQT